MLQPSLALTSELVTRPRIYSHAARHRKQAHEARSSISPSRSAQACRNLPKPVQFLHSISRASLCVHANAERSERRYPLVCFPLTVMTVSLCSLKHIHVLEVLQNRISPRKLQLLNRNHRYAVLHLHGNHCTRTQADESARTHTHTRLYQNYTQGTCTFIQEAHGFMFTLVYDGNNTGQNRRTFSTSF